MKYAIPTLLVLLIIPAKSFAGFPDVQSQHPNYDAILHVQSQKIVDGYPDGTFKPDQTINRAEFTKIITIASNGGLPTQGARACFKDIQGNEWYAAVVCWAQGYTAISGYPDGTFRPAQNINFAEAAKIVVKIFDPGGMSPVPLDEPWYRPYVQYLGEHNAIPLTINALDQTMTRGEMVEIIYRLEENIEMKPSHTYQSLVGDDEFNVYCDEEFGICLDYYPEWKVISHHYEEERDGSIGIIYLDHPTVMTGDTEVWIEVIEDDSPEKLAALIREEEENLRCYQTTEGQECSYCEITNIKQVIARKSVNVFTKMVVNTNCVERGQCTVTCDDLFVRSAIVERFEGKILLIQTAGGEELFKQFEHTLETIR